MFSRENRFWSAVCTKASSKHQELTRRRHCRACSIAWGTMSVYLPRTRIANHTKQNKHTTSSPVHRNERNCNKQITLTTIQILRFAKFAEPAPHSWFGALLPPRLAASVDPCQPTSAVQAIGDEIHEIILGSFIHKRPHRAKPLEQTCISMSNACMCCNFVHSRLSASYPPNRADTWCRCMIARQACVSSCVGLSQTAKCGDLGESAAAAGLCEAWQGARGWGNHTVSNNNVRRNQRV